MTQELKRSALHDAESYTVDQILDYEVDTNTPSGFRLQILWRGFQEPDATWETLDRLHEDVPALVRRYALTEKIPELLDAIAKLREAARQKRSARKLTPEDRRKMRMSGNTQ